MSKIKPEHFDILGVFFFPFVFLCALYTFRTGNPLPQPFVLVLLLSGVIGFVIDGTIVYHFLLKQDKK